MPIGSTPAAVQKRWASLRMKFADFVKETTPIGACRTLNRLRNQDRLRLTKSRTEAWEIIRTDPVIPKSPDDPFQLGAGSRFEQIGVGAHLIGSIDLLLFSGPAQS